VLFKGSSTSGEGKLIDLLLNISSGVSHVNCGVRVMSCHLGFKSLKGREENGIHARSLFVFKLCSYISSHSEVWVLVNSTWNQGWDVFSLSEDVRESVAERGHALYWRISVLSNVV
jgi:hypothetical protein